MKKWILNRGDGHGNVVTGYEEILEGSRDECIRDYEHYHEWNLGDEEEKIEILIAPEEEG